MSEDDAMRRGVVGVLLVALVAALLVALAPPAAACSCADTGTPPVAFEGVALGRTGSRDFDERWAFKETRTIRGAAVDVRAVNIATGQESACGFERTPVVGARYRLEVTEYEGRYFANICGGSFRRLAPATDDARTNAYYAAVHEDLLGRPPDQATLDYWSTYLDAGGSRRTMVEDRLRTRRSARRLAEAAGWRWVGRELAPNERAPLVRLLRRGGTVEVVDTALLVTLVPGDDPAWIDLLIDLVNDDGRTTTRSRSYTCPFSKAEAGAHPLWRRSSGTGMLVGWT